LGNKDGMNYAPKGKINRVVEPGAFNVGVTALDHGHINGMTNGLIEAGATIKYVYDPDAEKVVNYLESFPDVTIAESLEQILEDPEIQLVAAAAVPNLRSALGNRVMRAGKDYFTDKTGFTTLEQLEETKKVVAETGQKILGLFQRKTACGRCCICRPVDRRRQNRPCHPSDRFRAASIG